MPRDARLILEEADCTACYTHRIYRLAGSHSLGFPPFGLQPTISIGSAAATGVCAGSTSSNQAMMEATGSSYGFL